MLWLWSDTWLSWEFGTALFNWTKYCHLWEDLLQKICKVLTKKCRPLLEFQSSRDRSKSDHVTYDYLWRYINWSYICKYRYSEAAKELVEVERVKSRTTYISITLSLYGFWTVYCYPFLSRQSHVEKNQVCGKTKLSFGIDSILLKHG